MKHLPTKLLLAFMILVIQACQTAPATEQIRPTQIVVIEPPTSIPAEIVHSNIPVNLPAASSSAAADQDSARTSADNSASGGDRFKYGEYERPFNAIAMDRYFPYLDIQKYEIFQDDLWMYATIVMRSTSEEGTLPGQYALEIDNDIDGKGDFLIIVSAPDSADWSTANVQVWEDQNNDVGGVEPVKKDNIDPGFADGFETKVFDSGTGNDPDAAWARLSPDDPNAVQIAVKRLFVDDDGQYLAGAWAGTNLDPSMFDFNDKMTQEEAGAAVKSFAYYPIQYLAEMDSACRVAIGILISSDELGLCQIQSPQAKPDDPSQPSQPTTSCDPAALACEQNQTVDLATCQCIFIIP